MDYMLLKEGTFPCLEQRGKIGGWKGSVQKRENNQGMQVPPYAPYNKVFGTGGGGGGIHILVLGRGVVQPEIFK